jgi:hypothetical protein
MGIAFWVGDGELMALHEKEADDLGIRHLNGVGEEGLGEGWEVLCALECYKIYTVSRRKKTQAKGRACSPLVQKPSSHKMYRNEAESNGECENNTNKKMDTLYLYHSARMSLGLCSLGVSAY